MKPVLSVNYDHHNFIRKLNFNRSGTTLIRQEYISLINFLFYKFFLGEHFIISLIIPIIPISFAGQINNLALIIFQCFELSFQAFLFLFSLGMTFMRKTIGRNIITQKYD